MKLVVGVLVTESSSEGCKHDLGSHRVHKIQTKRKITGHKKDDSVGNSTYNANKRP